MTRAPVRIQRKRAKGWKIPENTVSVCRPGPFGNPFTVQRAGDVFDCREASAHMYAATWFREWVSKPNSDEAFDDLGIYAGTREQHRRLQEKLPSLRGKNLACFCKLGLACHADVLLEIANAELGNQTVHRVRLPDGFK